MSDSIFYVLRVHPHPTNPVNHHSILGKFWLKNGDFSVLEDHGMCPGKDLEKIPASEAARRISRFANSQRTMVVPATEIKSLFPEDSRNVLHRAFHGKENKPAEAPGPRISVFDYHREGMPQPQELRLHGSSVFLDGHSISQSELKTIMANIGSGAATLRHKIEPPSSLAKVEKHLFDALAQIRSAVKEGHVHPDAFTTLSKHLFTDTLVPAVGNKLAYKDFLSRPRQGVHIRIDGNSMGDINKVHGFDVGNEAIVALFHAARQAMDEAVGRKHAKLFRIGGDEAHGFVQNPEQAAAFARAFRAKMEAIPAIKGTHNISASIGYGSSPQNAEEAMITAKTEKKNSGKPKGQEGTHVAAHPEFVAGAPGVGTPGTKIG